MYDTLEFSVSDGSKILKDTMCSLGYSKAMAELGVWSALWLEERCISGIINLIVYLCLIKDIPFKELKPKSDAEFGLKSICPFMLSEMLIHFSDKWEQNGAVVCAAPAEVNLSMASLTDWAALRGKSLRLTHLDYKALYSKNGFEFETDDCRMFGWIDTEIDTEMKLELCDNEPSDSGCRKIQSIKLPKKRLRDDGLLNLT